MPDDAKDEDVTIGPPHLFGAELSLFTRVVQANRGNYCEFGLGGSTVEAIRSSAKAVVAIDSDEKWVKAVKAHPNIEPSVSSGRASILFGNIGPTVEWGAPAGRDHIRLWPDYISNIWSEWARRQTFPDVVFVDGRFRVACCVSVAAVFADMPGVVYPSVMIHDVSDARPAYKDVLDFFDVEEQVGTLWLLRLKLRINRALLLSSLMQQQFVPH